MNHQLSSLASKALWLLSAGTFACATMGCAPENLEDDSDDNKNTFIDGYKENATPAPPTEAASCNFDITQNAGFPSGVGNGSVVPSNISWTGFVPGADVESVINIADFYDCNGSRGIDAVVIDTSQYG